MNCSHCGGAVDPKMRFCPNCGDEIQKNGVHLPDNQKENEAIYNEDRENPFNDKQMNDLEVAWDSEEDLREDADSSHRQNISNAKNLELEQGEAIDAAAGIQEFESKERDLKTSTVETAAPEMKRITSSSPTSRTMRRPVESSKAKRWLWILPILSLIVVMTVLISGYFYQNHKTKQAKASFTKGEQLALIGNYTQALSDFNQALTLRPHFQAASKNKTITQKAISFQKELKKAEDLQKRNQYDQALKTIDKAHSILTGYDGKLIKKLNTDLSKVRTHTLISKLRFDMKGKKTIEELDPILQRALALKVPEAQKIAADIIKQILGITYNEAAQFLKEKDFTQALATIESGLKYSANDKKLIGLKKAVEKEKKVFEAEQQNRMQEALAAAAKEREKNLSQAVELVDVHTTLEDYSDLTIEGTIQSTATAPISDVEVYYTVYDSEGNVYTTGQVYVDADVLYPGDQAPFSATEYGANEEMTVEVNKFTWYLED